MVTDFILECYSQGLKTVFVISGHGGNFMLNPCLRHLGARHPEGQAVLVPESVLFGDAMNGTDDFHPGQWEPSLVMVLQPDSVDMAAARDYVPARGGRADLTNRRFAHFTKSGIWGHPTRASRAEGERLASEMVRRVCEYAGRWMEEDRT